MQKAFLFDMDGVLADTETAWENRGYDQMMIEHFGQELYDKVQIGTGTAIRSIYDQFVAVGHTGSYADFERENDRLGLDLYSTTPLTPGIEEFIDYLVASDYKLGVVSSSPIHWVKTLVSRLKNHDHFALLLSVNDHKELKYKPAPDPYLEAFKRLGVQAQHTIILEDSEPGVQSAKASGAHVICFTPYHEPGYHPPGADYYAKNLTEVQDLVAKISLP